MSCEMITAAQAAPLQPSLIGKEAKGVYDTTFPSIMKCSVDFGKSTQFH
jgi:hypothetical protein